MPRTYGASNMSTPMAAIDLAVRYRDKCVARWPSMERSDDIALIADIRSILDQAAQENLTPADAMDRDAG